MLDQDCIDKVYQTLGFHYADQLVHRVVDDLAMRLTHCNHLWNEANWDELQKVSCHIATLSKRVGLPALARCAQGVAECIEAADWPALDATLWRMTRVGEASVAAIWGRQNLSL